jgi:hypothetical protein
MDGDSQFLTELGRDSYGSPKREGQNDWRGDGVELGLQNKLRFSS